MRKRKATFFLSTQVTDALHAASLAAGGYGKKSQIVERALRKELLLMAKLTWQVVEDNGGGLHLFVFEENDVIYYADGYEHSDDALRDAVQALRDGRDPRAEGWELPIWVVEGEHDIQRIYDELTSNQYGWQIVADQDGIYPDRMGAAALRAFGLAPLEDVDLDDLATTYSDGGQEYDAIQLPWPLVRNILCGDHTGDADQDAWIIQALQAAGAPEWVQPGVEGWIDEHGWGIFNPAPKE